MASVLTVTSTLHTRATAIFNDPLFERIDDRDGLRRTIECAHNSFGIDLKKLERAIDRVEFLFDVWTRKVRLDKLNHHAKILKGRHWFARFMDAEPVLALVVTTKLGRNADTVQMDKLQASIDAAYDWQRAQQQNGYETFLQRIQSKRTGIRGNSEAFSAYCEVNLKYWEIIELGMTDLTNRQQASQLNEAINDFNDWLGTTRFANNRRLTNMGLAAPAPRHQRVRNPGSAVKRNLRHAAYRENPPQATPKADKNKGKKADKKKQRKLSAVA